MPDETADSHSSVPVVDLWDVGRRRLPARARTITHRTNSERFGIYVHCVEHLDGSLGAVSVSMAKAGSDARQWGDAFARLFTLALQYGAPLERLVFEFSGRPDKPVPGPQAAIVDALRREYLTVSETADDVADAAQ